MSNLKVNSINDALGGSNALLYGVSMRNGGTAYVNRIINGDMRIDQRNAGAAIVPIPQNSYTVDRLLYNASQAGKFNFQQNANSGTGPEGFPNYAGFVVASAYTASAAEFFSTSQRIEGFNISDLGWGSASAKTVTLSFWVKTSLAGTHSGALVNGSFNRSYPYSFTVSAANTWEYKTITIPGDTTGTWNTTNGMGVGVAFNLGNGSDLLGTAGAWVAANKGGVTGATSVVGTSGATFFITGVQLEAGSVASPFERRDYGRELMMAQRYCVLLDNDQCHTGAGLWYATTAAVYQMRLPVQMRTAPTLTNVSPTVTMYINGGVLTGTAPTLNTANNSSVEFYTPVSSGSTTAGYGTSARYTSGKSLLTSEL
jgi:hypothetical protein